MRIYDYKERDINEVLNEVRNKLNDLAKQDPDSFTIMLNYDGCTMLISTETKERRVII